MLGRYIYIREHISFSSTNGTFTKRAHILGLRKALVNFKESVSYFYSKKTKNKKTQNYTDYLWVLHP